MLELLKPRDAVCRAACVPAVLLMGRSGEHWEAAAWLASLTGWGHWNWKRSLHGKERVCNISRFARCAFCSGIITTGPPAPPCPTVLTHPAAPCPLTLLLAPIRAKGPRSCSQGGAREQQELCRQAAWEQTPCWVRLFAPVLAGVKQSGLAAEQVLMGSSSVCRSAHCRGVLILCSGIQKQLQYKEVKVTTINKSRTNLNCPCKIIRSYYGSRSVCSLLAMYQLASREPLSALFALPGAF